MNSLVQNNSFKYIAASEVLHFKNYDIFKRKDDIIQLQTYKDFTDELNDGINIVKTFELLKGKEKCLVLIVVEDGATFSKENREFIASAEVSNIVKADAFVINSLALKILLNGYLKFNKPNRPTQFFNSENAAVAWLNGMRD